MCEKCVSKTEGPLSVSESFDDLMQRGQRYQTLSVLDLRKVAAEQNEEQGGEEFLPEELIIAALIGAAFSGNGKDPAKELLKIVKEGGASQIDEAIAAVDQDFSNVFSAKTQKDVTAQLMKLLRKGSAYAGDAGTITGLLDTKSILSDMVESTKYFTNHYFNDHVVPELLKSVEKILQEGGNVDAEAYKAVREVMENRLKSVPYWRLVANASASRGFHYGAVKAGLVNGVQAYKIVAVLDAKTSEICKHMNGKEFWLADADLQVTRAALAKGDEIKYVAPWLREAEIVGKDANELRSAGFIMPPFHGNCRSTIRFI